MGKGEDHAKLPSSIWISRMALAILLAALVTLAVAAGVIEHNRDAYKVKKIAKRARRVGLRGLLSAIIISCTLMLFIIAKLIGREVEIERGWLIFLLSIVGVVTYILVFYEYGWFGFVKENWKPISVVISFLARV